MRQIVVTTANTLIGWTASLDWLAPLVLRLLFGYFWFETGMGKLQNIDTFTERFLNWGIPLPAFSATVSGCTDLIGGALLMLGLFTRLAAIPMMINMIVAIAAVQIHNIGSFDEFVELDELLYMLVLFWLMMNGPGRASLDRVLAGWLGIGGHRRPA
jgi:putative oxidoreductase